MFRYGYLLVFFLVACSSEDDNSQPIKIQRSLNDTGITLCGDYSVSTGQNNLDCFATGSGVDVNGVDDDGDIVLAGQDAHYGRDASLATNQDADGHAGFVFTKLDAAGNALPGSAISWVCIRDEVTGLIWEMKTDNGSLRDRDWQYTWYNSDGSSNGGNAGAPDTGNGVRSDNCFNHARCDTEKYIADINVQSMCGLGNWRLPSAEELQSIVSLDRVLPSIDTDYFPDTLAEDYWSASAVALDEAQAWQVNFYDSAESRKNKGEFAAIRLVHTGRLYGNAKYFVPSQE